MEFKQLQQLVETTDVFTEEMFETLTEFVNYNSNGMRVVVTEVLTTMKNRIDSGEEIQFYATGDVLTLDEFRETIWEAFGEEICEDVFQMDLDQYNIIATYNELLYYQGVGEAVNTLGFDPSIHGFDSRTPRFMAWWQSWFNALAC